ncbi:MAG: dTDP-4-dehydrorhamnose 3,5-epimerase [Limisphaerales bacterium]
MSSANFTILEQPLPGVLLLEPKVFGDARGFFLESYNERSMAEIGINGTFVQDNHSYSAHNVLRGLHYQVRRPQGKLVRVAVGEILDVVVDLRRSSLQFGKSYAVRLSGANKRMLWVPAGFAHGFCVVSESAHVLYKATEFYAPELERSLLWNDPDLGIDWQLDGEPQLSDKDRKGTPFHQAETYD